TLVLAHGFRQIGDLKSNPLEGRTRQVRGGGVSRNPVNHPSCMRIPVRGAETAESRHKDEITAGLDSPREWLDLRGGLDQPETIPEPLHGRPSDECASFEGEGCLSPDSPGNGSDEPMFREYRFCAGIHEEKSSRAIGTFCLARTKTGLPEES